jgi:enoyl-CoA hydratase/carnithine racemase
MNWPDKLNALNTQLSDALNDAWALFESDTSACVAVLAEPSAQAQTSSSARSP